MVYGFISNHKFYFLFDLIVLLTMEIDVCSVDALANYFASISVRDAAIVTLYIFAFSVMDFTLIKSACFLDISDC